MTREEREEREYKSLFTDQRYAKKAWRDFIAESLTSPGKKLPEEIDPKTESQTYRSMIDEMAYNNVKARLVAAGLSREPMQAELIVECNILRARNNDMTFNVILDRTAGKVKEEISLSDNPYEDLTDEELEALQAFRKKKKEAKSDNAQD